MSDAENIAATSNTPGTIDAPAAPDAPVVLDAPDVPATPGAQGVPGAPVVPASPDAPAAIDAPVVPAAPATPGTLCTFPTMCASQTPAITDMKSAEAYVMDPMWHSSRYGLERMRALMARLGNPQDTLRFVHVAGTNGKGSTCAYIAAILRAAGYRVGRYTSPHLRRINERITIDDADITDAEFIAAANIVRAAAEALAADDADNHPTEFELITAIAFVAFARAACDIVVLEVGLGGRLDATNIIAAPDVAVIARLGLDHTAILGNTLEEIAAEKAGIIKPGSAVVAYPAERSSIEAVLRAHAGAMRFADFARLHVGAFDAACGTRSFTYCGVRYETQLAAVYQPGNAALAIEAIMALREKGWNVPDSAVAAGVKAARWPGRFEMISANPCVIVDGGHNAQGAAALRDTFADCMPLARPVFIFGMLADKDYTASAEILAPLGSAFFTVTPPSERALGAEAMADALRQAVSANAAADVSKSAASNAGAAAPVYAATSYEDAAERALALAHLTGEPVCAFGSLYQLADAQDALRACLGADSSI